MRSYKILGCRPASTPTVLDDTGLLSTSTAAIHTEDGDSEEGETMYLPEISNSTQM